ncbi:uncharacterized protein N7529_003504 [Penicillium soppii]|jgi:hypothetical protein|uniref:uncharacterized protein n=1 Tax=Penicillium soppii TaxID=69789 RepID=UPI0025479AF2|nr:uncharacterized protein N7529_003504 [Penicillium soppii]KAJ5871151.1 hypothetical protein N7529_003504 [Penicillium soppii]
MPLVHGTVFITTVVLICSSLSPTSIKAVNMVSYKITVTDPESDGQQYFFQCADDVRILDAAE